MELLRRALLAAALMVVLAPTAARRRGSQRNRATAGPEREVPRAEWPQPEQMSAADEPAANASSLVRSKRVKRQLVIPNGLTVGIIPRFDYTVFTNSNGEQLVVSVDVEIDYTFPTEASSGRSALNRMSRILYDKQTIYNSMETLFTRFGMDGKACTLRAICEVGETPDHQDGLVGDFLNYLLSASYGVGDRPELKSYLQAERYGRKYGHCASTFRSCPISIFAMIPDTGDDDEEEEEIRYNETRDRDTRGDKFKKRKTRVGRAEDIEEDEDENEDKDDVKRE